MRTIVHESERRSEGYRDKMNEMLVDRERLQTELERLLQDSRKYVYETGSVHSTDKKKTFNSNKTNLSELINSQLWIFETI